MPADRRTILAVIGAGAVTVGNLGYLNRRRFRRLEDLRDSVNERSSDQWRDRLAVSYLEYVEAEAFAERIPETMALVLK